MELTDDERSRLESLITKSERLIVIGDDGENIGSFVLGRETPINKLTFMLEMLALQLKINVMRQGGSAVTNI